MIRVNSYHSLPNTTNEEMLSEKQNSMLIYKPSTYPYDMFRCSNSTIQSWMYEQLRLRASTNNKRVRVRVSFLRLGTLLCELTLLLVVVALELGLTHWSHYVICSLKSMFPFIMLLIILPFFFHTFFFRLALSEWVTRIMLRFTPLHSVFSSRWREISPNVLIVLIMHQS